MRRNATKTVDKGKTRHAPHGPDTEDTYQDTSRATQQDPHDEAKHDPGQDAGPSTIALRAEPNPTKRKRGTQAVKTSLNAQASTSRDAQPGASRDAQVDAPVALPNGEDASDRDSDSRPRKQAKKVAPKQAKKVAPKHKRQPKKQKGAAL